MVYSVNKLKDNVKKLIQLALAAVNERNENGCILFGKRANKYAFIIKSIYQSIR
jgi:hypothetical protein